jgi:predicted RNase H-like HicB family nuclease
MRLDINLDLSDIPFDTSVAEDGSVTTYNDELQVVATGDSGDEAAGNFQTAVAELIDFCLTSGAPLPDLLRSRLKTAVR